MYAVNLKRLERQLDKLQQQQQQKKKKKNNNNNNNNNKNKKVRRSNDGGGDDNNKPGAIRYLFSAKEKCHFLITLIVIYFCSAKALCFHTILNISSLK